MDQDFQGRTALVTGSTAGIGLAIARRLAAGGAQVIVNGRTAARVEEAVRAIGAAVPGARLSGLPADLATAEGCARAVAAALELDVLVNNLGIFEAVPFEQIADAQWMRILEANLMSGVRLSRHHLPRMLRRGSGRIVFISSESAQQIPAEMIHYGVTKTAQAALARGLAELTRGTAVTVNSVLAGPTKSEGVEVFVGQLAAQQKISEAQVEQDFFRTARPTSLLQRFESPGEIAEVVAFVASSRAAAINGAAVRADGGVVRSIF